MAINVGINGFGRMGRLVVRAARRRGMSDINFVAVNDLTDAKTLAHLFKYDSVHGVWDQPAAADGDTLILGKDTMRVLKETDPAKLPWKELGADIVLECTGRFTDRETAKAHLAAGARVVCVSAPAKGADCTFVFGVNEGAYRKGEHQVVSIGSCTTNCLAPAMKVLHDRFGIVRGFMTTIHAYTNDQRILDTPHKDLRRARAAAVSMIPTSTGAAKAIGLVLPDLEGKLDGVAIRVPTPDGSLIDVVCELRKETTKDEVNAAFQAAADGPMKGILQYCTDPIVSCDIVGNPHSSIVDAGLTNAKGNLVKVFSWYDNEWGFVNRLADALRVL
jgi:glyceraldehyde 3-phosphate dehydrogenase